MDSLYYTEKLKNAPIHFAERIKERYGIEITEQEYFELLKLKFTGIFKKSMTATIGHITYNNAIIYVIRNGKVGVLTTALLPETGTDMTQLINACFPRPSRNVAFQICEIINQELLTERNDFESNKEAALYYFKNSKFPTLLIEQYTKGSVRNMRTVHTIKKIIDGEHPYCKIDIKRTTPLN